MSGAGRLTPREDVEEPEEENKMENESGREKEGKRSTAVAAASSGLFLATSFSPSYSLARAMDDLTRQEPGLRTVAYYDCYRPCPRPLSLLSTNHYASSLFEIPDDTDGVKRGGAAP